MINKFSSCCDRICGVIVIPNDLDGDGYQPSEGDCDDNDPYTYPGAADIPRDFIDQDCDGEDNDANPENGALLFTEHCTICHIEGDFDLSETTPALTNFQLYIIIRYGFGPMPAFDAILTQEEIFDVLLFVRETFGQTKNRFTNQEEEHTPTESLSKPQQQSPKKPL